MRLSQVQQVSCHTIPHLCNTLLNTCIANYCSICLLFCIYLLSQECESLAQHLISGRIERAQEAEEMLQLRRDLSLARKRLEEYNREDTVVSRDGCMKIPPQKEEAGVVPEWVDPNTNADLQPDGGGVCVSGCD